MNRNEDIDFYRAQPDSRDYSPELRQPGSKRDMLFGVAFLVLSLLCVNFCFYGGCGIALGVAAMAVMVMELIYLLPCRRGVGAYMGFATVSYFLCAMTLLLCDSGFWKFFVILTMLVLSMVILMEYMGLRRRRAGTFHAVADWFSTLFVLPFEHMGAMFYALSHKDKGDGTGEKRKVGSVLIGLACAVPVLLIVVPLLMSADAAFENLLDRVSFDGDGEGYVTLIFGVGVFMILFSRLFGAGLPREAQANGEKERKGLDTTLLITFLSVICVVYVAYLVSQLAYFFNAFAGLLPKEFTVAQYARRGFFEMSVVCLINLFLLMVALLGAQKKNGKEPGLIRALALFLCIFSLVLIATAMSKMGLYIHSFGMTYLRIITSVFMIFLCVVFLTMCLWIFIRKLPYMKVAVITAVILVILVGFADPARVVAGYNVNAYLTGKLDSIDMSELYMLGSDAVVPYAWELTKDSNTKVSERAWEILYDHGLDHGFFEGDGEEYSYDWRAFNVSSYKAYTLIREHRAEIFCQARRLGYAPHELFRNVDPGVIKIEKELSYYKDFAVEGDEVRIYCNVSVSNDTGELKTVRLLGQFPEDMENGLLTESELVAEHVELPGATTFVVPVGRTVYDIVFVGHKGTGDQKADRLLPEILIVDE